ncbi:hypothetical protein J6590_055109, partial [Homalodisca vitripennis]
VVGLREGGEMVVSRGLSVKRATLCLLHRIELDISDTNWLGAKTFWTFCTFLTTKYFMFLSSEARRLETFHISLSVYPHYQGNIDL